MRHAARGALVLTLCLAGGVSVLAATTLPYRVAILPTWGANAGSDAFKNDLGHALADALSRACFTGVEIVDEVPAEGQIDLVLSVVLSDALEELTYEDSIAGALQPGEPSKELRRVARFEVDVKSTLETLVTRQPLESKKLLASISRRPMVLGEDPQVTVRELAIERIVSDLQKAYCRGGTKLLRKIQKALAEPPAGAPESR